MCDCHHKYNRILIGYLKRDESPDIALEACMGCNQVFVVDEESYQSQLKEPVPLEYLIGMTRRVK